MKPAILPEQNASPRAYRRLARKLARAGVTMALLERVARADQYGRTTPEALARRHDGCDRFLDMVRELSVETEPQQDAVTGRHLLGRGFQAGTIFGVILRHCRDVQDDTGWTDPEEILSRVFSEHSIEELERQSEAQLDRGSQSNTTAG